jgi:hypothetical protein
LELAGPALQKLQTLRTPTLLIVESHEPQVLDLNWQGHEQLRATKKVGYCRQTNAFV